MDENKTRTENIPTKAADILHTDGKIPSLRTYQGDMAEFIQTKNESVTSIALKEKAHREEKQKSEPKAPAKSHIGTVFTILISLILLVGGGVLAYYAAQMLGVEKEVQAVLPTKIIPYSQSLEIAALNKDSIQNSLTGSGFSEGVSLINFGEYSIPVSNLISILNLDMPSELSRNINSEFAMGMFKKGEVLSPVLILRVTEFGGAFAGMLEWEKQMPLDLSLIARSVGTSSIPIWKDVIIKNKDARVLLDETGQSVMAYSFLDKNTILITREYKVIPDINDLHAGATISR